MTTKQVLKLHGAFLTKWQHIAKLDQEGGKILASMANVVGRIPRLSDENNLGVLQESCNLQQMLLKKHFASLEKSLSFLQELLQDYQTALKQLQQIVLDLSDLTYVSTTDDATLGWNVQEWVENVCYMVDLESVRKRALIDTLAYADSDRIPIVQSKWSHKSACSHMDLSFVEQGETLAPKPPSNSTPPTETKPKKKNKNKKRK